MKNIIKRTWPVTLLLATAMQPALAHRVWILPSTTVLSGEKPWVTFDSAVSNNLFFPNHVAKNLDSIQITAPDGKPAKMENGSEGKLRSTFDLQLTQQGTYRVTAFRKGLSAFWKEEGEHKRWIGTSEELAKQKLQGKENIHAYDSYSRTETFVTCGAPSKTNLKPSGKGLELVFDKTHPNDLFAGENATFTMHYNGKPAVGVEVTIIKGNDRYRNDAGEIKVKTNEKGEFSITWKEAGRFWINASIEQESGKIHGLPLSQYSSYTATLEVLPE